MRRIAGTIGIIGLFLGVWLLGVSARAGAALAEIGSDVCLGCHGDKGLSRTAAGKTVSLFADQAALKKSVHAGLACTACHAGIAAVPHRDKLPPVHCDTCHDATAFNQSVHGRAGGPQLPCWTCHGSHTVMPAAQLGFTPCASCHVDPVQQYQGSVHGQAAAHGVAEAARCADCHGPAHQVLPQADAKSRTNRTNMAGACARCHADRALIERRKIPIPMAYQLYEKSVHGRAVASGKAAATCNNCHGSHGILRATDPRASVYREKIPATCGACHAQEASQYLAGIHGDAMRRGATEAPVCTDCHGEHSISAVRNPNSPVSVGRVTKTCVSCHDVERITEKYGLPSGRLETYQDSFHGLAARGGSVVAANCASCHGFHEIRPSSDPKSMVNKANLPATCGQCHPGAGANFAEGKVHVALTPAASPLLYWVRHYYLLLIVLTIAGMGLHNGLDFFRKAFRHYRRRGGREPAADLPEAATGEPVRFFLRMTPAERGQHLLLAASFLVLVYTGFALKFPESWPFAWLVALEKGSAIRAWIHRGAAIVMIGACVWHLAYLQTRRGRSFLWDMIPRYSDAKEVVQNCAYLVGLRSDPPAFDRFSYVEKAEYWALLWGSAVMIASGLVLWFENAALRFLSKWALDLATLVHYYEAWLATLAILVWHFYVVIFNPDVYPMNLAWLTGKVPEAQLRHEHPKEYERLREEPGEPEA
jgi:formate dehydrogenase gamma subunit